MAIVMTIDTAYELQTEFNRYDRSENFVLIPLNSGLA